MEEATLKSPDPQQVATSWRERLAKIRAQAEANTEIALQAGTESAERYLKAKWRPVSNPSG